MRRRIGESQNCSAKGYNFLRRWQGFVPLGVIFLWWHCVGLFQTRMASLGCRAGSLLPRLYQLGRQGRSAPLLRRSDKSTPLCLVILLKNIDRKSPSESSPVPAQNSTKMLRIFSFLWLFQYIPFLFIFFSLWKPAFSLFSSFYSISTFERVSLSCIFWQCCGF